jgi:hypothetical protein
MPATFRYAFLILSLLAPTQAHAQIATEPAPAEVPAPAPTSPPAPAPPAAAPVPSQAPAPPPAEPAVFPAPPPPPPLQPFAPNTIVHVPGQGVTFVDGNGSRYPVGGVPDLKPPLTHIRHSAQS